MSTKINSFELKDILFYYDREQPIFENFSLNIQAGQPLLLQSSQGQGKSLLMQIMGGLAAPQQGQVLINNIDINEVNFEETVELRLRMGIAFDLGGLFHNRTIYENLMLPLEYHRLMSSKKAKDKILFYLSSFGVDKYKDLRPSFVTGSVRKVAVVIRSLLFDPDILFMDDPFIGLNEAQRLTLVEHLLRLQQDGFISRMVFTDSTKSLFTKNFQVFDLSLSNKVEAA